MASTAPLRRITRASMARFACTSMTPDIEDIIPSETPSSPGKRKRQTATPPCPTKTEVVVEEAKLSTATAPYSPTRRPRKPARKTHDPASGAETVTTPSEWEILYNTAKTMRLPGGAAYPAAVDTMGCERLADTSASPRDQRFHTLVALMLSSQTKDTTNAVVMRKLKTELPGSPPGLNLENILAVEPDKLNELIWAVGFHNNKTKYLKQAAEILRDEWNGDIPDTIEGLIKLPGVGPKMAHLCLSSAWGRTEGIGVDVHVHRITNLWGWHKTKKPEETRMALQSWLPRDKWREINWLLVGLGQTVCEPVRRKCGECALGLDGLCKAADRGKVMQGRKMREVRRELEDGGKKKVTTEAKGTVHGDFVAAADPFKPKKKENDTGDAK